MERTIIVFPLSRRERRFIDRAKWVVIVLATVVLGAMLALSMAASG